jgi:hypothetical protein
MKLYHKAGLFGPARKAQNRLSNRPLVGRTLLSTTVDFDLAGCARFGLYGVGNNKQQEGPAAKAKVKSDGQERPSHKMKGGR